MKSSKSAAVVALFVTSMLMCHRFWKALLKVPWIMFWRGAWLDTNWKTWLATWLPDLSKPVACEAGNRSQSCGSTGAFTSSGYILTVMLQLTGEEAAVSSVATTQP